MGRHDPGKWAPAALPSPPKGKQGSPSPRKRELQRPAATTAAKVDAAAAAARLGLSPRPLPKLDKFDLHEDFDGLDEFGPRDPRKPRTRMRKLSADADASPMEQLRTILAGQFTRVFDLLRAWDEDGNQRLSKLEFRRALPALGLLVEREAADSLFDEFDDDLSGEIDYDELRAKLRAGADIELDALLRDGALGAIAAKSANNIALRSGLDEAASKVFGARLKLDAGVSGSEAVEQLAAALGAPSVLGRAIDLFRAWDEDGNGFVDRREFLRALPALGLGSLGASAAAELFELFDVDGSGAIEYREVARRLRRRMPAGGYRRGSRSLGASPRLSHASSGGQASPSSPLARVKQAQRQEEEQRRALSTLRRKLQRAEHEETRQTHRIRKAAEGQLVRDDMDRRVGRDLTDQVKSVAPATSEEVTRVHASDSRDCHGHANDRCGRAAAAVCVLLTTTSTTSQLICNMRGVRERVYACYRWRRWRRSSTRALPGGHGSSFGGRCALLMASDRVSDCVSDGRVDRPLEADGRRQQRAHLVRGAQAWRPRRARPRQGLFA